MSSFQKLLNVRITGLVHGGRAIGLLPSGKKVFVWNALPGEKVGVRLISEHRTFDEAIAEKVIESSIDRELPQEDNYLDTSPWQIMNFEAENRYKKDITQELLSRQKVNLPMIQGVTHDERKWHYRNKMQYRFMAVNNRLHLALYERASHSLCVVEGSMLAMPAVDRAANSLCTLLNRSKVNKSDLKSIIVRSSLDNKVAASLYVGSKKFPRLELPKEIEGLRVYYNQTSNTSISSSHQLYLIGDCTLEDKLINQNIMYDVDTFFQINLPVFETALKRIKLYCQGSELIDMYAGVGTIGLSVASSDVDLIEINPKMAILARLNAERLKIKARVFQASSEEAIDKIAKSKSIIFDPPREGLSNKIITKILTVIPPKIVYLSCNPATQARDLSLLQQAYKITYFEVFNFFPRTPHIETLAVLVANKLK